MCPWNNTRLESASCSPASNRGLWVLFIIICLMFFVVILLKVYFDCITVIDVQKNTANAIKNIPFSFAKQKVFVYCFLLMAAELVELIIC